MNASAPSMSSLFEPCRSAEPPKSSGRRGTSALSTVPLALRVAWDSPGSNVGRASARPSGSRRARTRRSSAARSASADSQAAKRSSHSACSARPRSTTERASASTSSATWKVASGSMPMIFFVAATSSAPSAEPWASPVSWASGAGYAMIVRTATMLGASRWSRAVSSAVCSASASLMSSTRWVCHP